MPPPPSSSCSIHPHPQVGSSWFGRSTNPSIHFHLIAPLVALLRLPLLANKNQARLQQIWVPPSPAPERRRRHRRSTDATTKGRNGRTTQFSTFPVQDCRYIHTDGASAGDVPEQPWSFSLPARSRRHFGQTKPALSSCSLSFLLDATAMPPTSL